MGRMSRQHGLGLSWFANIRVSNIFLDNLGYFCCLVFPQPVGCPLCGLPADIVARYELVAGSNILHLLVC